MENVSVKNELSSRPERSEVEGPAVPFTSIQFDRKSRLFIRSEAEGSAVSASQYQMLTGKPFCSSGAYPDFLLAALEKAACAVFCKENRMRIATPPTSTGNLGQPRDLQFRGPFLEMF